MSVSKSLVELGWVAKSLTDAGLKAFYGANRGRSEAAKVTSSMTQRGRSISRSTSMAPDSPAATNTSRRSSGVLSAGDGVHSPSVPFRSVSPAKKSNAVGSGAWSRQLERMATDSDPAVSRKAKTVQERWKAGAERRENVRTGKSPRTVPLTAAQNPATRFKNPFA
jgi:hypothetical protein